MGQPGLMGIFSSLEDLLAALRSARKAEMKISTVFSPTPHHEIQEILGVKASPVRIATLLGGIAGVLIGLSLAAYAHLRWNLITGGKPVLAWIPFCVIAFEFCILVGFLSTLVTMFIANHMPRFVIPDHYDPRFTEDRFGLLIVCGEGNREKAAALLLQAGVEEIREIGDAEMGNEKLTRKQAKRILGE
jgi:hypothetical protein